MQQRVNNHEKTVIERYETLVNARFANASFDTFQAAMIAAQCIPD
jgi:hypothetical protein